ncbi:MAG: hypothetical protein AAGB01_06215 [Cyanobacteria bacterium P01_F01_bin.42]
MFKPMPDGQVYQMLYPALAQHFADALARAVQASDGRDTGIDNLSSVPVEPTRVRGLYRSAIALLGSERSRELAQRLSNLAQTSLRGSFGDDLRVSAQDSGWIELRASTAAQFACINSLAIASPVPVDLNFQPWGFEPEFVFELQYAHARCCSLTRRAAAELLSVESVSASWIDAYFTACQSAVEQALWSSLLNFSSELTATRRINPCIQHSHTEPAEYLALVKGQTSKKRLHQLGLTWVRLFQRLYDSSQIFSLTLPQQQPLLALRLMLFYALRNLLEFLLTELYCASAPQIL